MKQHNLVPGSQPWHDHRAHHFNAADAAAMMGASPHESRAQLMHRLKTGAQREHSDFVQDRILASGHRFEELCRPLGEEFIGQELYQQVGTKGELSASFDGLTIDNAINWEHKRLNSELRAAMVEGCTGADLPLHYQIQMEHQMEVSDAQRTLFQASEWKGEELIEERHCWYEPNPALRASIIAGWKQFAIDYVAYVPTTAAAAAVAAPVEALPAVIVTMTGALTVESNLDKFGVALRAFIDKIPAKPSTDQEFADTDAACKALKKVEDALETEENRALATMADVQTMRALVKELRELAGSTRRQREKLVEERKAQIRIEEISRGKKALDEFLRGLNQSIGKAYMPQSCWQVDFGAAIKGLRTIATVRAAIDQTLANAKIAANDVFTRIQDNLRFLRENAAEYVALFPDTDQIVLKLPDDLQLLVTTRIAAQKEREQKIRDEAQAKADKEAREKLEREQREAAEDAAAEQAALTPRTQPAAEPIAVPPAYQRLTVEEAHATVEDARSNFLSSTTTLSAGNVVPIAAAKSAPPSLRLGQINERIAPLSLTADGLTKLGFPPAGKERSAVLYHESDFPAMCEAIARLMVTTLAKYRQQAA